MSKLASGILSSGGQASSSLEDIVPEGAAVASLESLLSSVMGMSYSPDKDVTFKTTSSCDNNIRLISPMAVNKNILQFYPWQ